MKLKKIQLLYVALRNPIIDLSIKFQAEQLNDDIFVYFWNENKQKL